MEKILVTGGAGYIGSVMVPHFLSNGYQVTVLDSFIYGQTSLLDACHFDGFKIMRGDTRNESLMKKLLAEHDIIIPLAAIVGAPACSKKPIESRQVNFESVKFIADNTSSSQKIVFPVTNSGYGIGEKDQFCNEESPLRPISQYGIDKVEAEKVLLDKGNAVTFRLATVFGISPRMRLDLLVNDFVYRAVTEKSIVLFESHFKRNFIHVRDVTNAFHFAIKNYEKMKGNTFNHGLDDANLSKFELCQQIKKHIPEFVIIESEIGKDPDKRDYIVSNEKLAKLGYRNQVSLDDGIIELMKGYQIVRKFGFDNL